MLNVKGFFVVIGYKLNIDIFKGWLDMDDVGYLVIKVKSIKMNIEGVFVSGDV